MQVKDLGDFQKDMILFGGPYSNLQATQALMARAEADGIAADHMICTGDVVAYCAQPVETVALIRKAGIPVVAGNCEKQLAANALDCGCGFDEGTTCDLLSAGWYAHANAQVSDADRLWMGTCPDIVVFTQAGRRFAVIHGGVTDIARFIWSVSPEHAFLEEINALKAVVGDIDAVISGHSGIAFQCEVAGVTWINAGVIGMPPHDAGQATQFVRLSGGEAGIETLAYDAETAHQQMVQAGLVQGYHDSLLSGIWPSEDVLPQELRR